jgi:hypothetical protein
VQEPSSDWLGVGGVALETSEKYGSMRTFVCHAGPCGNTRGYSILRL